MKKSNRRQFLRNTSIVALSAAVLPQISEAKADKKPLVDCDPTTLDYFGQGPFYTENPPLLSDNKLASDSEQGQKLIISGRVLNLECAAYIPETLIDIWHANDEGAYDNQGFNLRGYTYSNAQGYYLFETILPGKYLNGAQYRPSHIHFKITPPGFPTLTTQLYFEGDIDIPSDAAASLTSGDFNAVNRIVPLSTNTNGEMEGVWDIVVNGNGILDGVQDLHLDKGMIYNTFPNPFTNRLEIRYGVFKRAKIGLLVFNINGQMVAELEDRELSPEKYEAIWEPEKTLPNGHYFIALKVNDLQVHYLKVIKQ